MFVLSCKSWNKSTQHLALCIKAIMNKCATAGRFSSVKKLHCMTNTIKTHLKNKICALQGDIFTFITPSVFINTSVLTLYSFHAKRIPVGFSNVKWARTHAITRVTKVDELPLFSTCNQTLGKINMWSECEETYKTSVTANPN